jgi:hypothetical protein
MRKIDPFRPTFYPANIEPVGSSGPTGDEDQDPNPAEHIIKNALPTKRINFFINPLFELEQIYDLHKQKSHPDSENFASK